MPRHVSSASTRTNIASESTNQAAIVGTNAPKRSNCDCIRLFLQNHACVHEIAAQRLRSDNDPVQCFDFIRLSRSARCYERMAAEGICLGCPLAQFPERGMAQRLRQSDQ